MSVDSATVVNLLENIFFEPPAIAGSNALYWSEQSQNLPAASSLTGLADLMAGSQEIGIAEHVYELYTSVLGRAPTGTEISYYTAIADAQFAYPQTGGVPVAGGVPQATWDQITSYFTASPEFTHKYEAGTGVDPVAALYQNVLGRAGSTAEIAYYQNLVDHGTSMATLVQYFVDSPEYRNAADPHAKTILESFGEIVAENGGQGHGSVLDMNSPGATPPVVQVQLAGANYATQAGNVVNPGGVFIALGTVDPAVLTVNQSTTFGQSVTTVAQALGTLETGLAAHHVAWGVFQGNTYVVESQTGTVGPTDTTVVELTGVHTLSAGTAGLIYVA